VTTAGLRDPATLLAAWEAGSGLTEVAQGAAVLDVLGVTSSALDQPLGEVARLAAGCYVEAFGPVFGGVLRCAGCGGLLDVAVPIEALFGAPPSAVDGVRAPTTRDMVAAAGRADARDVLLRRCTTDAGLAPRVAEERLEVLVGPALPTIRVTCPDCGGESVGDLDVAWLLWTEVAARAPAVLGDIARLAAAFGWSEGQVLALSPWRRAAYLEMVGQ
jgi:hypothetical protein